MTPMNQLPFLQQDHITLSHILEARRAVTVETLPVSTRILWGIYLLILDDALQTVHTLIGRLESQPKETP